MTKEFIIVIEVDNIRAAAAYGKGLDDLAVVWPQLMFFAEKEDKEHQIKYDALLANYKKEKLQYEQADAYYDQAVKEWENKKIFQGSRPIRPEWQYPYFPDLVHYSFVRYYNSIRNELQDKFNIANAACTPYRMTEYQVKEMITWEDNSKIESLMKEINK